MPSHPLFLPPPLLPGSVHLRHTPFRQSTPIPAFRISPTFQMQTKIDPLGLPSTLRSYIDQLSTVPDPKLRYQQLLFLARKLPPMDPSLKTEANRVLGCTSVVHVDVRLDDKGLVRLQGDSDAQLTKGLLALLVNGLDGVAPNEVANVDAKFINESGLSVSLTPSRNNGFVNMLAKIKHSVATLETGGEQLVGEDLSVYDNIVDKLGKLKPVVLEVKDDSDKHAGHAGIAGISGGETHFAVKVVAEVFENMTLVQRHRLIYTLLTAEMEGGVHALQIEAQTPGEAGME